MSELDSQEWGLCDHDAVPVDVEPGYGDDWEDDEEKVEPVSGPTQGLKSRFSRRSFEDCNDAEDKDGFEHHALH